MDAVAELVDVGALFVLLLTFFGIIGMQIFKGVLRYRCFDFSAFASAPPGELPEPIAPIDGVCSPTSASPPPPPLPLWYLASARPMPPQGTCDAGEVCADYGINPFYGTVSFDNILAAWMSIFQVITLEGWVGIVDMASRQAGRFIASAYFITVVLLGSIYLLNLFLAVVWQAYRTQEIMQETNKPPLSPSTSFRRRRRAMSLGGELRVPGAGGSLHGGSFGRRSPSVVFGRRSPALTGRLSPPTATARSTTPAGLIPDVSGGQRERPSSGELTTALVQRHSPVPMSGAKASVNAVVSVVEPPSPAQRSAVLPPPGWEPAPVFESGKGSQLVVGRRTLDIGHTSSVLEVLVESPLFERFVVSVITANAALAACEAYPMDVRLGTALELADRVVVGIFVLEMGLKHLAWGTGRYWSDSLHCFDGLATLFGFVTLTTPFDTGLHGGALRSFRLLRELQWLAGGSRTKSGRTLRRVISATEKCMQSFVYPIALLALLLYVFAIVGMQFFGYRLAPPALEERPRLHFDDLAHAMLSVTIIAVGDGWDRIWQDTARTVGRQSALFFIALIVLANYVLLNLVFALLLGCFDDVKKEELYAQDASPIGSQSGSFSRSPLRRSPQTVRSEDGETEDETEDEDDGTPPYEWVAHAGMRRWLIDSHENDMALGVFGPKHPVRQFARGVVTWKVEGLGGLVSFNSAILVVIVLSSVALTLDGCHLTPDQPLAQQLRFVNALII